MHIYIMTDLEGVAGILDKHHWTMPGSMYYEKAKQLLTREVNAACRGFLRTGATRLVVCDGHGPGGINPAILHEEAELIRGMPTGYPCGLTRDFQCVAWVGQHAKSNTPYAHLAHTGNHQIDEYTINGLSVGEFGQFALCASSLGVTPVFASGDAALCREAEALFPGIGSVAVKEGLDSENGKGRSYEEYDQMNGSARHLSPRKVEKLIEEGAFQALARYQNDGCLFPGMILSPPYVKEVLYRSSAAGTAYRMIARSSLHIWDVINDPGERSNLL